MQAVREGNRQILAQLFGIDLMQHVFGTDAKQHQSMWPADPARGESPVHKAVVLGHVTLATELLDFAITWETREKDLLEDARRSVLAPLERECMWPIFLDTKAPPNSAACNSA